MKTITDFTQLSKPEFTAIREAVTKALESVGKEFGVRIQAGNISYEPTKMNLKLVFTAIDATTGEVKLPFADNFKQLALVYGFKSEDLGKSFRTGGQSFTLEGIDTRKRAKPVIAKGQNGKLYAFTIEDVKRLLA